MKTKIIIGSVVLLFLAGCGGGPYKEFAQCLTDANVVMYGTDWCSHCADQKAMFGEDFDYINYVNCDFNSEECSAAGVYGYPTWNIDGELLGAGVQTFQALGEAASCTVPTISFGE